MKILFALLFIISTKAYAEVPLVDCWTVDGASSGKNEQGQLINDGQWIISLDPKLINKDELIWVLDTTNSQSLRPIRTIVRPEYIILGAKAVDDWANYPHPSPREEIQRKANAQMNAIAALRATTGIGCNSLDGPGSATQ